MLILINMLLLGSNQYYTRYMVNPSALPRDTNVTLGIISVKFGPIYIIYSNYPLSVDVLMEFSYRKIASVKHLGHLLSIFMIQIGIFM